MIVWCNIMRNRPSGFMENGWIIPTPMVLAVRSLLLLRADWQKDRRLKRASHLQKIMLHVL